ncbi:hypothetical protein BX600DRAFT_551016 [Xylariales sp. PMI_506]|nr:hypothetical protein BX600DRAFT_551016 [Xylariales sp. PMI_506]
MELTPIRIPGKRRWRGKELPPARPLHGLADCAAGQGNLTCRRDGIISKRQHPDSGNKRKTKRSKRGTDHEATEQTKLALRRARVSYLERQLPLEIIERIFWMSENVGFLRAGARIGYLLSGEPTRRETFLRAFGPTWDTWLGCVEDPERPIVSYVGWENDANRFGGNPEFQSALLEFRWLDIEFILRCQDIWVQRHRHTHYRKLWGNDEENDNGPSLAFTSNLHPPGTALDLSDISTRRYFEEDFASFCARLGEELPPPGSHRSLIEVHRHTRIPDILLTGPLDKPGTQKLFWLLRAGARLVEDQTWETTLEGYHHALGSLTKPLPGNSINLPVIKMLFLLGGNHWPSHVAREEFEKLQALRKAPRYGPVNELVEADAKYAVVSSMLAKRYPEVL